MSESDFDVMVSRLESSGLLTERQAEAFVHREILDRDREETAERMDTTKSNVSNLHSKSREKYYGARHLVERVDDFTNGGLP